MRVFSQMLAMLYIVLCLTCVCPPVAASALRVSEQPYHMCVRGFKTLVCAAHLW
jgi:hypothetical protein